MKTCLCYGDSNTWGAVPVVDLNITDRWPKAQRWTSVLQDELGADVDVIAEGLRGRTTAVFDPAEGDHLSGNAYLKVSLLTHAPLDLVILMLGTNDLQSRFAPTPERIARGIGELVGTIREVLGRAPEILIVCPPPIQEVGVFSSLVAGGSEVSRNMADAMAQLAARRGAAFLDAKQYVQSSDIDGIHLDANAHRSLGRQTAVLARQLLSRRQVHQPSPRY